MERILRGIMRYRNTTREQMVKEFQKVRDNPEVCTYIAWWPHVNLREFTYVKMCICMYLNTNLLINDIFLCMFFIYIFTYE